MQTAGHSIRHLALPASFPRPTPQDLEKAGRALLEVPPDLPVIIDGLAGGALDTSILRDMRAPYIALAHHPLALETGLSQADVGHFTSLERANLALASHVIVTSPYTAALLQADYGVAPNRITVALPSLPTRVVRRDEDVRGMEILSVGLLAPRKGHDVLLDALARVRDLAWTAAIVGRAQDRGYADQLKAQSERLGLGARVRFLGEVSEAQLSSLFAKASIFALASRFEGYGIAFSEALAAGLPVIGCQSGAVPFTVPSDAGLLVPADDPGAFAASLRRLIEHPSLRKKMANAALRHARSLPTWEETARIVADVVLAVRQQHHCS